MQKTITFSIPCYNSAGYMDHCVKSILEGSDFAEDVQIVIVDDGSTKDDTLARARAWQERHPSIVKAVHQENGGHGVAVMKALEHAEGVYFKNIDSDDWVDAASLQALLAQLRRFIELGDRVDLVITNYVYEHVEDGTRNVVDYGFALPKGRVFGWGQIGHFNMSQYLLMHALCYRTDVLRAGGVQWPAGHHGTEGHARLTSEFGQHARPGAVNQRRNGHMFALRCGGQRFRGYCIKSQP